MGWCHALRASWAICIVIVFFIELQELLNLLVKALVEVILTSHFSHVVPLLALFFLCRLLCLLRVSLSVYVYIYVTESRWLLLGQKAWLFLLNVGRILGGK